MTTYTLTGDLGTLLGADPALVRARLTCVSTVDGSIVEDGEVRFVSDPVTVATDGTFTVADIPSSTTGTHRYQYRFTAEYASGLPGVGLQPMSIGPFEMTANTDLADVAAVDFVAGSPAGLAAIQGFWLEASEEPPVDGDDNPINEKYGVPIVWIDLSEELTPVPVNPAAPDWDDYESTFQAPDLVGIDYIFGGATVVPETDIPTSGTYPREVEVEAVAQPGYTFITSVPPYAHTFPDPAGIIVLTSDGYTAANGTDLSGRSTDAALGGTAKAYTVSAANQFLIQSNRLTFGASGSHVAYSTAKLTYLAVDNVRLDFDVISTTGEDWEGLMISVPGMQMWIGGSQPWRANLAAIGGQNANFSPPLTYIGASAIGHYALQQVGSSFRVEVPNGNAYTFEHPSWEAAIISDGVVMGEVTLMRGNGANDVVVIDNLVMTQMGF